MGTGPQRAPIVLGTLLVMLTSFDVEQPNPTRCNTYYGDWGGAFYGLCHAIAFAQMRRAVCQAR